MDVKRYEIFLRVVESGSLTRAAEKLGCTQSAVSHALNALEEELGFSLMRRSRGGVKLTEEGERLLPSVRTVLNAAEHLEQAAAAMKGLETGTVRVGTFTSVAVHWLPGMIKDFRRDFPGVDFRIMSGDYHDVSQWLTDGSVDMGFVALPCEGDFRYTALAEDRILAVVPPDHRFAALPRFPLSLAADEPFISLLEASDQDLRRALDAVGVTPNVTMQTKDDYAIIAMVENGLGISIMPELLLKGRSDNVRVMELSPSARRTIALATPEQMGPAAGRFAEYAVQWVKKNA